MARYFQKTAEARWRKHLDKLEGDELYDMAHKMSGNTDTMPGWWGDTGQRNLAGAYRNGITDKRVIKAIVSDAGKEITPKYRAYLDTRPLKDLSAKEIETRKRAVSLYSRKAEEDVIQFHKKVEKGILERPVPEYWGKGSGIDPEKELKVTHGGGERHIKDVLGGKKEGYELTRGPSPGIQVVPGEHPDPAFYANKAVRGRIDHPATLTGTIKAKYLYSGTRASEAGIPAANIKHLKDAVVIRLKTSDELSGTVKNIIDRISKLKR